MLILPTHAHTLEPYHPTGNPLVARAPKGMLTRTAFAAAHVVSDPLRERNPWDSRPAVDWDATLAFREGLWDQGLALAEAMDTAQRGMGLDGDTALDLIKRSMAAAKAHPLKPRVVCGAGTDHKPLADLTSAEAIAAAYEDQAEAIEAEGGQLILLASPAFAAIGADRDSWRRVYRWLIDGAAQPVILDWPGEPAPRALWGCDNLAEASDFVMGLIAENPAKVDGIRISLLDQSHEEAFRAFLPKGVRLYTGDEFNYPDLIAGDGRHLSHALLGIFAAVAPAASQALEALALGDLATYHQLLTPTLPLAREIFRAPRRYHMAAIAFLSWLNGHQAHFVMPAGLQSSRDITHYAQVFRLADQAGLLAQPGLAERRMAMLLALHGIG